MRLNRACLICTEIWESLSLDTIKCVKCGWIRCEFSAGIHVKETGWDNGLFFVGIESHWVMPVAGTPTGAARAPLYIHHTSTLSDIS